MSACDEPLPDGAGFCGVERAPGGEMCGPHLMAWIRLLTEALRTEHEALYLMLLRYPESQHADDAWSAIYTGGPMLQASETRMKASPDVHVYIDRRDMP